METRVELRVFETAEYDPPQIAPACPYLGVRADQTTYFSYPSPGNMCFALRKGATASLDLQAKRCLSPAHSACPVFARGEAGQEWEGPLPAGLLPSKPRLELRRMPWVWVILLVGLIWLALWLAISYLPANSLSLLSGSALV